MSHRSFRKSRARVVDKEDYYTHQHVISDLTDDYIIPLIKKHKLKYFVDFSAGDAYLADKLAKYIKCINIDKHPARDALRPIIKQNFLKMTTIPDLPVELPTLVGFNPPFGRNGKLAIQFIEHAIRIINPDYFACILPHTAAMKSYNTLQLLTAVPLNQSSFYSVKKKENVNVPSVFVIFKSVPSNSIKTNNNSVDTKHVTKIRTFITSHSIPKDAKVILLRRIGNNCGRNGWFKFNNMYHEFRLGKITENIDLKRRPSILDETHLIIDLEPNTKKTDITKMITRLNEHRINNNTKRTFSIADIKMALHD